MELPEAESGSRSVLCSTPYQLGREYAGDSVPCGQCPACIMAKRREWTLRCIYEQTVHESSIFVTLTYNNDNLPKNRRLVKKDLQLFFKRLRHLTPPFKYYACGEVGDRFGRPHYHAIIFGLSDNHKEYINIAWEKGFTYIGSVNPKSINYVSGYLDKKILHDTHNPEASASAAPKYFMVCSKGLGLAHAKKIKHQMITHGLTVNGTPVSIPRYFHKKLELPEKLRQSIVEKNESDYIYTITGVRYNSLKEFYKSRKYRLIEYYKKIDSEKKLQKTKNILAKIKG